MLNELVNGADLLFLIAVRILAIIETAPLLSGEGVPQAAKVTLAGFAAAAIFPWMKDAGFVPPDTAGAYAAAVVGEAMIGVIIGFFLSVVFAAFITAGQFFSLQMGFGASETYDPLAQSEIPIIGQFLNLIAMYIFLSVSGFQKIFLIGVRQSFISFRAADFFVNREDWLAYVSGALGAMFADALVLSFPIFGTLLLVSVTMGLLSKAAPQMNLLTEGFPLAIITAFVVMATAMPFMVEAFAGLVETGFQTLAMLMSGGGS
ncbi:MAG: flagellar biosynthetic protein FliR [Spirochaetales bacterium]|nr:MAG: flagellar biosynthetic protein FliR [Spirochaetales bacterium]